MPFFGIEMKTDLFQSYRHCWDFQICWHIECITLTASSFRILNSSAGTSSPPLALFVIMLLRAHLASHSRMFSSRWVGTLVMNILIIKTFLYSFSVFSCHLFLISSASVRSLLFLSFIFLLFFYISFHCLVKKASYLSLLFSGILHSVGYTFPSSLAFYLIFSTICKASSDNHLVFLPYFFFFFKKWEMEHFLPCQ